MAKNTVSEALRLLRVYSDLKQSDLARRLGILNSTLSELETGKKPITPARLKNYAKIFDIEIADIIRFAERLKDKGFKQSIFRNIINF